MPLLRLRRSLLLACAATAVAAPQAAPAQVLDLTAVLDTLLDLDVRVTLNAGQIVAINARIDGTDITLIDHGDRLATQGAAIAVNTGDLLIVNARVDGQAVQLADNNIRIGANTTAILNLDQRVTQNDLAIRAELASGTIGLVQQQGPAAAVTVAAATGGTVVSIAGTSGDRRLSGVAAGQSANDAANLAQVQAGDAATLGAAQSYTDARIAGLVAENNHGLRKDIHAAAAGSAALAALPQSIIPGRGTAGAAIGGRGDELAFALGLSKAFAGEHVPVLRAGAAIDARRGTVSYNASIGFHF